MNGLNRIRSGSAGSSSAPESSSRVTEEACVDHYTPAFTKGGNIDTHKYSNIVWCDIVSILKNTVLMFLN